MPLLFRADILNLIKWWVDSLHKVHGYMRVHTVSKVSLGHGLVISMSKKQKIDTRRSMEVWYHRVRWRSTRVPKDAIIYRGAGFQCWWVLCVSVQPQRDSIGEKWALVEHPVHKTHVGCVFFIKYHITVGDKLLKFSQQTRFMEITSRNLCRYHCSGKYSQRSKGYLVMLGIHIFDWDNPVNH